MGGSAEVSMAFDRYTTRRAGTIVRLNASQKRVNRKQSFRHKLGALHSMTAIRRIVVKSKTGQLQALSWQLGISLK